nr:HNH endonuclease signature motif containing protein [Microbacterium flavescens]
MVATRTSLTGDTLPAAFSSLREAAANGNVGVDTISAITRTLGSISDRCRLGEIEAAESELVRAAIGAADVPPCAADETRMQARVWAAVLDPDGALPEHERSMRRRGLVVGRERGGLTRVTGDLIPDVAAQLTRLLDAHLSPRVEDRTLTPVPNGPTFTPDAEVGSAPPDPRTRTQRQHDALAALLGAAARSAETPTLGGASPTLLVTIAASELESDHGIGHIDGTETTVPAYVARHVACSGGVQRLVFDDAGRVIELGDPQRVFTAAQRRAITARDGGCVIPGCHVPAAWCEFHHVEPHARGGSTHTDNGVMLCWFHHRTLATNGWAVAVIEGVPHVRAPRWLQPDGDWRPTTGSAHLQRQRLKRRRSSA